MLDQPPLVVDANTPLSTLLTLLTQSKPAASVVEETETDVTPLPRSGYALVTENQELIGIFTERDLVKLTAEWQSVVYKDS